MASHSRSRRTIVAAVGTVSIIASVMLVAVSSRVNGEATTTTSTISTITSARAATSDTTTTVDPFAESPPSPLRLYPRRPGAKYEDVEALPGHDVSLGLMNLHVLRFAVAPHTALPARSRPGVVGNYTGLGLIDGYTPYSTHPPGEVLHVVMRITEEPGDLVAGLLSCVATAATDGTVLVPFAFPAPHPKVRPPRKCTSHVARPQPSSDPQDVNFYFPLGARRGRFYVTCVAPFLTAPDRRGVWGSV